MLRLNILLVGNCHILVAFIASTVSAADQPNKSEAAAPQSEKFVLERVPGKTPEESMACIEIADGFRIELVAAEPEIFDPVAIDFDEAGRMFVVDMIDYSELDKARLGRIRLLTDEDGDGRYETSKVFLDDLSWPTAVACYDGGIFIGNPPEIIYAKDTDGDGRADERRVVFDGFNRSNVQGMLNSFRWGFDQKIYGAASSGGGEITSPDAKGKKLDLRGHDFAIEPKTMVMEATTGGGQHGLSFNRWGDRFGCHNSDHLQAIVFEERYVARNPYQSIVSARRSIAADGPQATVFRISPVEAWREARTKLRLAGLASGPVEGGGRSAGYFTSATGVTAYEGGLWGDNEGLVYVADVGSNLIHRKRLVPDGVTYRGERIDDNTEFIRSTDLWFRPVQMTIGPEGALYIADMYREVIEHPASLPAELKNQLDLNSGNDRGRIYRVVPKDYKYKRPKSLAGASTDTLVAALDDANQWRRTTALRLLYEQQDKEAVPALRKQLNAATRPEGRISVLYALNELGALSEAELLVGLTDKHPQVRRHAIRLSEPKLDSSKAVLAKTIALTADVDPVVQFQLALSLGESQDPSAAQALGQILLKSSSNPDIVAAVLSSIADCAGVVLQQVTLDKNWITEPTSRPVVDAIVAQIARQQSKSDMEILVAALTEGQSTNRAAVATLLKALSKVPTEAFAKSTLPQVAQLQQLHRTAAEKLAQEAHATLERGNVNDQERLAAIENLALGNFAAEQELLSKLLSPQEPAAVHSAVLSVCAAYEQPEVADLVLAQWDQFAPSERTQALDLLLRREAWALKLGQFLANEAIAISTLDPSHVAKLENFPSAKVREVAKRLRGQTVAADRRAIFNDYKNGALAEGDAKLGQKVFEKNCASCHQVSNIGHAVGPNLSAMVSRGTESMLFNVLVPNGEVDPKFLEYVVVTSGGEVIPGVIAGETSTAVTIRGADNKTSTVLRVDIEEMQNTRKSLMPEGFEKTIDKKSMANLLTFIKQSAVVPTDDGSANRQ